MMTHLKVIVEGFLKQEGSQVYESEIMKEIHIPVKAKRQI